MSFRFGKSRRVVLVEVSREVDIKEVPRVDIDEVEDEDMDEEEEDPPLVLIVAR
jgi:hypothetical protein